MNEGFGPHLTLYAKSENIEKLYDLNFIFEFMNQLPEVVGMTKITQPYVFRYAGLKPEDYGVTGVTIIAESHISIHTFAGKKCFFFDIFSCKPFDYESVIDYVRGYFRAYDIEAEVVFRGLDFDRT